MILVSDIYNDERRPTRRLIALMQTLMRRTYNGRGTNLFIDRQHFEDMIGDSVGFIIGEKRDFLDGTNITTYLGLQIHYPIGLGDNYICVLEDDFGNSIVGRY